MNHGQIVLRISRYIWYTFSVYGYKNPLLPLKSLKIFVLRHLIIQSLKVYWKHLLNRVKDLSLYCKIKHKVGSWIFNLFHFIQNVYLTFFLYKYSCSKKIIYYNTGAQAPFIFSPLFMKRDVNKRMIIIFLESGIYRLVNKLEGKTIIYMDEISNRWCYVHIKTWKWH